MDRNREARRAAAMANGLQRRRQHRTTTNSAATLRDSPEEEGQVELPETAARLRDRTGKKDRDREMRDRDRDRERERLSRSKRRRRDKYMHGGGGNIREDGGGGGGGNSGVDDSSEESVNDEEDDEEDSPYNHHHHHLPPPNPVHVPPAAAAGTTLTSHRKSYPPPSKVYRVTPSWKAPDEMIGVSIPRKARSASTKRSHECWSTGGVGGGSDQINRQSSSSPVTDAAAVSANIQSPSPARPMSPSSSNISMKKKIKPNGPKQRPPKSSSTKSPPVIQDEIEIEVAEVLYGLMRSQAPPSSTDSAAVKLESRSTVDSKPPPPTTTTTAAATTSSSSPLTVIAPKRKRPRLSSDEVPRATPIPKQEAPSLNSDANEGSVTATKPASADPTPPLSNTNGILSDKMMAAKESSGEVRNGLVTVRSSTTTTKVEEASSSSPKLESSQTIDRVQLSSTSSIKPSSLPVEKEHRREDKCQIDLMAPASPENGGTSGGDEKMMVVTDMEIISNETKPKLKEAHEDKPPVKIAPGGPETVDDVAKVEKSDSYHRPHQQHSKINLSGKEKSFDLQLDLENDTKLNLQPQKQQRNDSHLDKIGIGGQSSSVPLPMSMPTGWHGGLAPMGYVGPLQGVVSMDGTTMATPPIQPPPLPHFLFSQPKPKRCATHGHIAKSISAHQQMMKINPFWPAAAAAGTAQLLGAKPYNLNLVPSTDLHSGRGGGVQDIKGPPFTLFPGPPPTTSTKDKSPQAGTVNDSSHKQFLSQPGLPPGSTNIMHGPALFFPMGQQQAAASARPGSGKSPSTGGAASTSTSTSASMGAAASNAPPAGPAMSFSYPNVPGNEAQFMAILGNNPYPFPIPAHVGAAPPYRGSHPQAMSFFNGSFYSSQMLHPSQLQQAPTGPVSSQSMQLQQQQNQQIASISTASSSSQKHLQGQQQRHQGNGASNTGNNPNQSSILQNFQGTKGREMGGEDSPSSADSRRSNMSLYGPNFPMPFHSPNFALIPSSLSGGANNGPSVPNVHNHGDKKQQQQSQQAAMNSPFPMSFATINGVNTPGLDISSMAHNHALFQSLPEAAKQSYQMMAAAAAAQAAQQRMTSYRGPDDGKSSVGMTSEQSNLDDERRAMAARATAASGGQSIAFSRDLAENSVVDSSARSLNLGNGSSRPARSSGSNNATHSTNSQQQQQQSQMLFPKQQQYTPSSAGNARSKTPSTSNGNVYPDHLTSSSIMAAKFQNNLSGFPSLVQSSGGGVPTQQQWKNSVRPNTSQMSSPSLTTSSTPPNLKNLPQQQGRPQHTQISFGAAVNNSKPNPSSQGPQTQNATQAPSSPMMVGSPSNSSMSKSAGGSPRTSASNKSVGQTSTLSNQQGKNSPSPSLSNQKPSILGGPHVMSTPSAAGKPQSQQQPHQQPQLSKQSIQQAQLYFSNYMQQQAANTSGAMASPGYYLQRHPKSHAGSGPPTSSSGMLSLSTPVSFANVSTSDPTKAVASSNVKGGLNSQGMSQSGGAARQLMPASLPYTSTAPPVKPTEQKHPAGE